jgi:hypothetical protein
MKGLNFIKKFIKEGNFKYSSTLESILMKMLKWSGPKTDTFDTPENTLQGEEKSPEETTCDIPSN